MTFDNGNKMEFKTILIDPPWKLCSGGSKSLSVHSHYPVQTKQEIIETILDWIEEYPIAKEAHLYLWTINSYSAGYSNGILDAVEVCKAIGFRPVTNIMWIKNNQSNPTPYGQRGTEICLFGAKWRKGKRKEVMYSGTNNRECVVNHGLSSSIDWFKGDRRDHSRKPDSFYDYIMNRSKGPYLEFYSRTNHPEWTAVGNQKNSFQYQNQLPLFK